MDSPKVNIFHVNVFVLSMILSLKNTNYEIPLI